MGWWSRFFVRCLWIACALSGSAAMGQDATEARHNSDLAVAVKVSPPFAYKSSDGSWVGLSVELWQKLADRAGLTFHFVEAKTVAEQIDGVAKGRFDFAVSAITVTAERERKIEFSQPYYRSGFGVAVQRNNQPSWRPLLDALTSFGLLQAIVALTGIALLVGLCVWFVERAHNEQFGGNRMTGLLTGIWWSTTTATQSSTGNISPRTGPGRIVGVVWMFASVITVAVFTASVTSSLTVTKLQGDVRDEADLRRVKVGVVKDTSTTLYLDLIKASYTAYPTLDEGLEALRNGKIGAFVYDKPILDWTVGRHYSGSIEVLDADYNLQAYAIAMADGNPHRRAVNVALLETIESDWWSDAVYKYLGEK